MTSTSSTMLRLAMLILICFSNITSPGCFVAAESSSLFGNTPHTSLKGTNDAGIDGTISDRITSDFETSSLPQTSLFLQTGNVNDTPTDHDIMVVQDDGSRKLLNSTQILLRLQTLSTDLGKHVNLSALTDKIVQGLYPNVTAYEIDTLAAESAASLGTQHIDYARLAARILVAQNHKQTPATFSEAIRILYDNGNGFISNQIADVVERRSNEIDSRIVHERDYNLTYFGYKTLERAYLLRDGCIVQSNEEKYSNSGSSNRIIERLQYLWMRVALGIHCMDMTDTESEDDRLQDAFETYDCLSKGYFTHASPTLFHAGTTHPQLSSCFLVQMLEDSIQGIYETLQQCAVISKAAGGIGLSVHNIRARGSPIRGTRGVSNGLVPMLRVFDVTSRYVDQGGGKRPGAFAVYIEPWHSDIFDVLNLKKNHGKEEQRARDLFYGLWVPDLFMRRVQDDGQWSLMCPQKCPGLNECYGSEFDKLYTKYESEGKYVRQVRARELWSHILESQIETGTPYMLYKDACNAKSNQNNLGTIQCSNLCTEIVQYTSSEEVAVCNLASICLSRFVVSDRGPFGSVAAESGRAYFDHAGLHRITKIVTRNLNRIIDTNSYPTPEAERSNLRHRPIGIGVSGLADAFLRMGLPFVSPQARQLNEAIFETIYHAAVEASNELASRDGPYESFQGSLISQGKFQYELWGTQDCDTPSQRYYHTDRADGDLPKQIYADACATGKGYDWEALRQRVMTTGVRNSLLVAPMPTASTSQILGVNECFEPFSSNLYIRRVKAGEFIMANPHLLQDLTDRGLWTPAVRNQVMRDGGSIQNIVEIPDRLKQLYKTVWEIKMKDVIDMAADRGKFIDQSQSLNLFIADPTMDKLTAMHFYAWKKGLKTGMYYLRTKPAVNAIQYTVDRGAAGDSEGQARDQGQVGSSLLPDADSDDICLSCSA